MFKITSGSNNNSSLLLNARKQYVPFPILLYCKIHEALICNKYLMNEEKEKSRVILQGNLVRCSRLTPNHFGGLGYYLTRIGCWRSDTSYLSVVFEKKLLQRSKLTHSLPIFTSLLYAYSEYLYLKIIFLDSLLVEKPFLR